jgi:hypothetical protein
MIICRQPAYLPLNKRTRVFPSPTHNSFGFVLLYQEHILNMLTIGEDLNFLKKKTQLKLKDNLMEKFLDR